MPASPTAPFPGEFDPEFDELDTEIRQGDVISFVKSGDLEPEVEWAAHLGVIVTADCDLVFGKHSGILSYVPIVPLPVYLRLSTFPRILESQRKTAVADLEKATVGEADWPTVERLVEMIELGDLTEELEPLLEGRDATEHAVACLRRLTTVAECMRSYDAAWDFDRALAHLEDLFRTLRSISGHSPLPVGDRLGKELTGRLLQQLPGDCFFIAAPAPGLGDGYVAYLRLIREISHDVVATSAVAEKRMAESIRARRIGRLSLIYLHRLTQQMAQVFTDIGLPRPYETNRDATIESSVRSWVAELPAPTNE